MASKASTWVMAGSAFVALASAAWCGRSGRPAEEQFAERLSRLAASVDRLERQRPAERDPERPDEEGRVGASASGFDRSDIQDFEGGRGPHPIVRRFEREEAGGRDAEARQGVLEAAVRRASEGLDADVYSAVCRVETCRVEVTFDSMKTSKAFFARAFVGTDDTGKAALEHGGVYAPVQEKAGDRHRSVFYVMKKRADG